MDVRTRVFAWLGPFSVAVGAWSATTQMLDYTNGKWRVIVSAAFLILSLYCASQVYRFLQRRKGKGNESTFAASDWAALISLSITGFGAAAICVILTLAATFPQQPTPTGSGTSSSTSTTTSPGTSSSDPPPTVKPMITSPIDGFKTNDTTVPVKVTAPTPAADHKWMLAVQSSRRQDGHCWFYQLTVDGPASYSGKPGIGPSNPDKARGIFTVHLADVDATSEQAITQQMQTNENYYTDNGMPCPSGMRFYHQIKVERP